MSACTRLAGGEDSPPDTCKLPSSSTSLHVKFGENVMLEHVELVYINITVDRAKRAPRQAQGFHNRKCDHTSDRPLVAFKDLSWKALPDPV